MSAKQLRCPNDAVVLANVRPGGIRPARGVALGTKPDGAVVLVCPRCGSFFGVPDVAIVLRRRPQSVTVSS